MQRQKAIIPKILKKLLFIKENHRYNQLKSLQIRISERNIVKNIRKTKKDKIKKKKQTLQLEECYAIMQLIS